MEFDVVSVGGAVIDLFLLIDDSNPHFKFNEQTKELDIHLGDKIILEDVKFSLGGNASNVAVGIKRLGFKSSIVCEIGNDEFSTRILNGLSKEGIDTSRIKKGEGESSFSIILNLKGDRTIFTKKVEREHDFSFENLSSKWVYLTSLGNKWENAYRKVYEFVKDTGAKLAFNPGGLQLDAGLQSYSVLLSETDVLILNMDEAKAIVGEKKDIPLELKKLGPRIVVVTDGAKGSYAVDDNGKIFYQEILKADVISKTGAGDAYASGFLGAILSGKDIQTAMLWGTKNAASVIGKVGAQTGLLSQI